MPNIILSPRPVQYSCNFATLLRPPESAVHDVAGRRGLTAGSMRAQVATAVWWLVRGARDCWKQYARALVTHACGKVRTLRLIIAAPAQLL
jgi:hypothetical protein